MGLTRSLRSQVAVSRFIDDVSVLAIEDCLISKLPKLLRSSNVLEMDPEVISRLVGETAESSRERERLVTKQGILETGLQSLKSLHKRSNLVKQPVKQDQVAWEDPEPMVTKTPGSSATAPEVTNGTEVALPATTAHNLVPVPDGVAVGSGVDAWRAQADLGIDDEVVDWGSVTTKVIKKKRFNVDHD
jgi:hypothetical protein